MKQAKANCLNESPKQGGTGCLPAPLNQDWISVNRFHWRKKKKGTCVNHIPQHKSSCRKRIGFTFQNYLNPPQLQTPAKLNILCEQLFPTNNPMTDLRERLLLHYELVRFLLKPPLECHPSYHIAYSCFLKTKSEKIRIILPHKELTVNCDTGWSLQ